jgi:hypothetical protein
MHKLEAAGVTSLKQLAKMELADLQTLGVTTRLAKQIVDYSQRRLSR